jgi:acyl carrier protein
MSAARLSATTQRQKGDLMTREAIRSSVYEVLSQQLEIPTSAIADAMNFRDDLQLDSLSLIELSLQVEQRLGVRIDENKLYGVDTVSALVDFLVDMTEQPMAAMAGAR